MKAAAAVTIFILLSYGILTGFSVSTMRAVGMTICMLIGKMIGRAYDMASALSLMGMATLIANPLLLFHAGFLLSYGAVLGILLIFPALKNWMILNERKIPLGKAGKYLTESFLISTSVCITTTPILLYFFYETALYSIIINILVLPFVAALVGIGFVAGGISLVFSATGKFLFGTVYTILRYYELVAELFLKLPYPVIRTGQPEAWTIVLYYSVLLIICAYFHYNSSRKICWLLLLLLLIFLPKNEMEFTFTMLDVGQGDGMYLSSGGKHILVDGGSSSVSQVGKYRIVPYLKWNGIKRIDYIFISHSDDDHTNGILELLEQRKAFGFDIGCLILPGIEKKDEAYKEIEERCRKAGVKVIKIAKGDRIVIGKMALICLHPDKDYDWKSENDYSMALQVRYVKSSILLTGDLEKDGEEASLAEFGKTDVLKVGHHGSQSSSSEQFLQRAHPTLALISAGENNRYGHPHKLTLEALKGAGAMIFSTIEHGAITITGNETSWYLEPYKNTLEKEFKSGKINIS